MQVERKDLEKQMGDLGLEMDNKDDVRDHSHLIFFFFFYQIPSGPFFLYPLSFFWFSVRLQSHYAQQARRSRSVTRKRKREASAPPTSKVRSQSASRPPRDQSGMRDVKVCDQQDNSNCSNHLNSTQLGVSIIVVVIKTFEIDCSIFFFKVLIINTRSDLEEEKNHSSIILVLEFEVVCVFVLRQMVKKAKKMMKNSQKDMNRQGKKGEADRHVFDLKPKHLLAGKRKSGTTDRR